MHLISLNRYWWWIIIYNYYVHVTSFLHLQKQAVHRSTRFILCIIFLLYILSFCNMDAEMGPGVAQCTQFSCLGLHCLILVQRCILVCLSQLIQLCINCMNSTEWVRLEENQSAGPGLRRTTVLSSQDKKNIQQMNQTIFNLSIIKCLSVNLIMLHCWFDSVQSAWFPTENVFKE